MGSKGYYGGPEGKNKGEVLGGDGACWRFKSVGKQEEANAVCGGAGGGEEVRGALRLIHRDGLRAGFHLGGDGVEDEACGDRPEGGSGCGREKAVCLEAGGKDAYG